MKSCHKLFNHCLTHIYKYNFFFFFFYVYIDLCDDTQLIHMDLNILHVIESLHLCGLKPR